MKGRLGFKQYIPNKRARFGIKMFSLCEVSGYLWNRFVYLGKNYNPTEDEINYEREQLYLKRGSGTGVFL